MVEAAARPELMIAAREGDERAREALCEQWLPVVVRWCTRLGGPGVDADDAAADVFEKVLGRLEMLRNPRSFDAWIYGVTRRVLAAHRRRAWIRRWVPGIFVDPSDPAASPQQNSESADISRKVQGILEMLPDEQREVLVLCDIEERTDLEVAGLTGVALGTVKSRLRLARSRFRREAERLSLHAPRLALVAEAEEEDGPV